MTILYYVTQLYQMGGVERVTTSKINWYAQNGHTVVLALMEQGSREFYYTLDPRVHIYRLKSYVASGGFLQRMWNNQRAYKELSCQLREIIDKEKPDVAICTDAEKFPILPLLMPKGCTFVEFHTSREFADTGTPLKEKLIGYNAFTRFLAHKLRLGGGWNRICWHYYGTLVVLTGRDRSCWVERLGCKNIRVIPNPLPYETERQSLCDEQNVLALGRLADEKDFSSLIDIWAIVAPMCPDWKLRVVGEGPLRKELQDQVERLGLQHSVRLEPATAEVIPYYLSSSVFAMSSKFEGFGLVLAEAQACGLPSVSYDCACGPSDIIEDGVTGFLITPGDKQRFAERLSLLMRDVELRKFMGRKAHEASGRFFMDDVMVRWLGMFEEAISKE